MEEVRRNFEGGGDGVAGGWLDIAPFVRLRLEADLRGRDSPPAMAFKDFNLNGHMQSDGYALADLTRQRCPTS